MATLDQLTGWMPPGLMPTISRVLNPGRGTIFMLHRFKPSTSAPGYGADSVCALRAFLSMLRKSGYDLVSLSEILDRLETRSKVLHRTVCFTVDDGYSDFYDHTAPVFREFDCPATVFLVTGFLDGFLWLWWDQLQHMFESKESFSLSFQTKKSPFRVRWDDKSSRSTVLQSITEELKTIGDLERMDAMGSIAQALGVSVPETPPSAFAPMTWAQVRELGDQGFTFAPHTVSHPILSRSDEADSYYEIDESWTRLRAETDAVVPVFAYPNGQEGDFSDRERGAIRDLGFRAALTAEEGHVMARDLQDDQRRYDLPRFGFPEAVGRGARIVTGITRQRLLR